MVKAGPGSSFLLATAIALACVSAQAQTQPQPRASTRPAKPPPKKKSKSISGSPLDTLMQTRLKADVPPAQDFVRATHPDPTTLDYTPLTGTDPERPKPRDKANVMALQAELERDGALNARKANGRAGAPAAKRHREAGRGGEP